MAPPAAPKRALSDDDADAGAIQVAAGGGQLAKRARVLDVVPVDQQVVTAAAPGARTSGLAAPTLLLTGHSAAVYSLKFDASGQHAASASFDRSICASGSCVVAAGLSVAAVRSW